MKVEQIYTGCLAQGAYYIQSNGEAAIIDPLREIQPYLAKLGADGNKLKYIFETHFHADFVSGHVDLAKETGAEIVFGPTAQAGYEVTVAKDDQIFELGNVKIKVLHTPGHTMESSCFLLIDENGKEHSIYTGDTLFIGDVGRPDLAVKSDLTQEDLAAHLYDSLRNKVMPLSDDIIVYPGHGAGSACGKNMSKETFDTLGHQKEVNYALRADMTKEEFVKEVLTGIVAPPQYFPKNAMMNKFGYKNVEDVIEQGTTALDADEFESYANAKEALVLDTRKAQDFKDGFIPNSIFIGIDGGFAPWVGTLIVDLDQPILLVTDPGREEEVVTRLARVGYDNTLGYLKGGFKAWKDAGKEVDTIVSISPNEFEKRMEGAIHVLDVRKASEHDSEHIASDKVQNFPLDFVNLNMKDIDKNTEYYVHCAGGYRSMIMASILKSRGFEKIIDVAEGFNGIKEKTNLKMTEYVCPSTML
ncbi:MAG: MBL fold metallo-hydrolase [Crocinitomicaceae bacterium]|nr:MBL fold metallo-hydrolase [Crocinitomicaceae bacterium]